jgi:hypothetical protein
MNTIVLRSLGSVAMAILLATFGACDSQIPQPADQTTASASMPVSSCEPQVYTDMTVQHDGVSDCNESVTGPMAKQTCAQFAGQKVEDVGGSLCADPTGPGSTSWIELTGSQTEHHRNPITQVRSCDIITHFNCHFGLWPP